MATPKGAAAVACMGAAGTMALLFLLGALQKRAPPPELALGVLWVFALSLIVSASILPPILKRRASRATAVDPVCGMDVDPAKSPHSAAHGGQTYHFCAAACRESFLREPSRYTGAAAGKHTEGGETA